MASDELRRRAGSRGAGDAANTPDDKTKKTEQQAEDVTKILRPDFLEFTVTRQVRHADTASLVPVPCKLIVPTEFTLGDIVQRDVESDFEAWVQLVMFEVAEVSGNTDLRINPIRMFLRENLPYIDIVVRTSNVRKFLNRILSKAAYVIDPNDEKQTHLIVLPPDLEQLTDANVMSIGAHLLGRWFDRWAESRRVAKAAADEGASKNSAGAATTSAT